MGYRTLIAALAICFGVSGLASAADTNYVVNSNGTFVCDATIVGNDNAYITAYSGAVIDVAKKDIHPHIHIMDGEVTVRPAEGVSLSSLLFASGLWVEPGATLKIGAGVKSIAAGRANVESTQVNFPIIDVQDVRFEDEDATGIVLKNKVTVRSLPAVGTCPVAIADGATLALQTSGDASLLPYLSDDPDALALDRFDVIVLTKASIPNYSRIDVSPGRTFTFRPSTENGWNWRSSASATGYYDVRLGGKGAKVVFRGYNGKTRCESEISGVGEIVVQGENSTMELNFRNMNYKVAKGGDPIVIALDDTALPPPSETWKAKVSHWFDADKADSIVKFTYDPTSVPGWEDVKNEFDGHPIVIGWKDARADVDDIGLYISRIFQNDDPVAKNDYVLQVMPYLVEGGLNGKNYLSFGKCNVSTAGAKYNNGVLAKANEARRLYFWKGTLVGDRKASGGLTTFETPYCIMVYSSANGGGKALIGTDGKEGHGDLGREASSTVKSWTQNAGFEFAVDGRSTNPQSTAPNGRWQIVSLDLSKTNTVARGIGSHVGADDTSASGGQEYAEIIFFKERLTPGERFACETYLAEKWGLTGQYRPRSIPYLTLTGKSASTVSLSDSDYTDWNDNAEVLVDGDFQGLVNVPKGRTLVVADKPQPPSESSVPQEGLSVWIDPLMKGAVVNHTTEGRTSEVGGIYARTLTGLRKESSDPWLRGHAEGTNVRSPFSSVEKRGPAAAPAMTWIDYTKNASGDAYGNTMRLTTVGKGVNGAVVPVNIRQAFIVADTSLGGGSPFGDNVEFGSAAAKIKRRTGNDVNAPIWSPSNTVTMSATWLDTTEVDGTTHGFSGRPEVLSFTTESDFPAGFFGDYNKEKGNYEVLGEILLYSTPLEAAAREAVQKYLAYKWWGELGGCSDLTKATVAGEGTVKVPDLALLPRFGTGADAFTGAVSIPGEELRLDAAETVSLPCELALPETFTVKLRVAAPLAFGTYTLVTAASGITGADAISVDVVGDGGGCRYKVVKSGSSLLLKVSGSGLIILLK